MLVASAILPAEPDRAEVDIPFTVVDLDWNGGRVVGQAENGAGRLRATMWKLK